MKEYTLGYKNAVTNFESFLTAQIERNGGAQTPLQILNVFNAMITYLHSELQEIHEEDIEEYEQEEEEVTMEATQEQLRELFEEKLGFQLPPNVEILTFTKEEF